MKKLILAILSSTAIFASAKQTIDCRQLDRKGLPMSKGGRVHLILAALQDGKIDVTNSSVEVTGFNRTKGTSILDSLEVSSINQSNKNSARAYTTFFFHEPEGMLDIQLQFDDRVLNRSFTSQAGTFVIGSEDASPEFSFAYGYKMICRSEFEGSKAE